MWARKKTLQVGALIAGLVVACAVWEEWRTIRFLIAATRSTSQFRSSPADARVFYEPGAESLALAVTKALPSAIATVEREQFGAFEIPVRVYVCASIESFVRYGADPLAAGLTSNHRVFLSPKLESSAERIPRVVAHELSHLHLGQRHGPWEHLPAWFVEGLATEVSDGGGAEGITPRELHQAIIEGRTFEPKTSSSLWAREGATANHLSQHLFYGEAGAFIAYLRVRDPSRFPAFIRAVESAQPLATAFEHAYGTPLRAAWQGFVAAVKSNELP